MENQALSGPKQVLTAFSQKRAGTNEVLRSLVSHQNWLAPLTMLAHGGEQKRTVKSVMVLSAEAHITPGELWLFTDAEAALRAQAAGALPGSYAGGISGTEVFRNIPAGVKTVRVNPGSAVEETWMFQDGGGIEAAQLWAEAVALEESFEQWERDGRPDKTAFINYRAFLAFNHSSGPVITLPNQFGMSNPAVTFTAPDCALMFLSRLSEEQRAELRQATVDGNTLLQESARLGIDGVIINVFGPGATYSLPFESFG